MIRLFSFIAICLSLGLSSAFGADCAAVGGQVAQDQGGKLARSTPSVQNGKDVCVVVVVVPGRNGEKPRRVEVAVPAN